MPLEATFYAQAMPWAEDLGHQTLHFDEWKTTDHEIRTFVGWTTEVASGEYERQWQRVSSLPVGPDGPDAVDLLFDELGGLMPHDHEWMLHAAAIKDGVTAFEVYLEQAANDILRRRGAKFDLKPGRTPQWPDLVDFYADDVGAAINTAQVAHVRELRHLLTHQRGELRTDDQRARFGAAGGVLSYRAELNPTVTTECLDVLATVVRSLEPSVWQLTWS